MSRFFSSRFQSLTPYTPGEQPKERQYIKLNTNESPFSPSLIAQGRAEKALNSLQLYPDPDCKALTEAAAKRLQIAEDEIIWTNGSDDVLNFAFMAFCSQNTPAIFPDITYGFYPVFANINAIPYEEIPLKADFSVDIQDYIGKRGTVFIANPNAPTGLTLSLSQIEELVKSNPNRVVVIDEAYVDFGADSAVSLIHHYDNLLVTQTFSKSRSMAGARLGFAVGNRELIKDLNTLRYSTNPYNINAVTMAAGIGALEDEEYFSANIQRIIKNREKTANALKNMGFEVTDSKANFLFAKHRSIAGEALYLRLKEAGVLVRHFKKERIAEYCRITVGSAEEMERFLAEVKKILEENQ